MQSYLIHIFISFTAPRVLWSKSLIFPFTGGTRKQSLLFFPFKKLNATGIPCTTSLAIVLTYCCGVQSAQPEVNNAGPEELQCCGGWGSTHPPVQLAEREAGKLLLVTTGGGLPAPEGGKAARPTTLYSSAWGAGDLLLGNSCHGYHFSSSQRTISG